MRRMQRRDNAIQPGGNNVVSRTYPLEVPDVVEYSDSEGEKQEDNVEHILRLRRQVKSNQDCIFLWREMKIY